MKVSSCCRCCSVSNCGGRPTRFALSWLAGCWKHQAEQGSGEQWTRPLVGDAGVSRTLRQEMIEFEFM
jgi:hypothetical protein